MRKKIAGELPRLQWHVAPMPAKWPVAGSEQFVKDKEAAQFLAMGIRTLHGLVADGSLPSYKVGGSRRFRKSELAAALVRIGSMTEVLK